MLVMRAILFDTLAYAKKLIAAGFTKKQAEAQAESIAEVINDHLATKKDIEELRVATKRDIDEVKTEIKNVKNEILIKVGGMIAASIAIIAALVKLL
jgi:hypothetical protein